MKKLIAMLMAVLLCVSAVSVLAEDKDSMTLSDMFSVEGKVLTVRVPEGSTFDYNGTVTLETLAEGEVNEGVLTVSFIAPAALEPAEAGLAELIVLFPEKEDGQQPIAYVDLTVAPEGEMTIRKYYFVGNDICLEYGPREDGVKEGYLLTLITEGNPSTGYEWTCIPDNSGVLTQEEVWEEPETEDEEIAGAPCMYFWPFHVEPDRPGNTASLIMRYARGWEATEWDKEIVINLTLNDNNDLIDLDLTPWQIWN